MKKEDYAGKEEQECPLSLSGSGGEGGSADSADACAGFDAGSYPDPFDHTGEGPDAASAGTGFEGGAKNLVPRWLPWLFLLAMLAFAAAGLAKCSKGSEGAVKVGDISPSDKKASRLSTRTSPAYREQLHLYAEGRAKEALASGGSFIEPAQGADDPPKVQEQAPKPAPKPADPPEKKEVPKVEAKPDPPKKAARKEPAREAKAQKAAADRSKLISRYLSTLVQDRHSPKGRTVLFNSYAKQDDMAGKAAAAAARGGVQGDKASQKPSQKDASCGVPGMQAGDILYAVNRVTIDSDAPGPAMVEVVLGPYKGAKAIGSFARHGEHLVLTFSELVTAEGESFAIQGYAIDPETDRTAVRSSVDTHALERWGGLVASSFLEGFGDATRRSGTSSYSSVYGSGYSTPKYSLEDEAWIAAGKVGERLSREMEKSFSQPPTVVLKSGTEMGVLLLRVSRKTEQGAAASQSGASSTSTTLRVR